MYGQQGYVFGCVGLCMYFPLKFDMWPDTYLAPMLLFQKIIIAIEMLTKNQKVGSLLDFIANHKLATSYFYSEAEVLQQALRLISLPEEH